MYVQSREEGDVLIAYITQKRFIDNDLIDEFGKQLMALIGQCPKGRMLLNFKVVEFASKRFFEAIFRLNKKCKESNVDLRLCEIPPGIMAIFKVMMLDRVANIQNTEEDALASFDK